MIYNKSTIDHAIYINILLDGSVSCLTFYIDDVINATNNETVFPELRIVLKDILILISNDYLSLST